MIVPDITMVATANAAVAAGARVVFADVDPVSLTLSVETVAPLVTNHTKVVVFVHLNNRGADGLAALAAMCRERGVALLEDAEQAVGARFEGQHAGTFGDLGTFSFSSPKIISTGQGGVIVVPKSGEHSFNGITPTEMAAKIRRFKNFGRVGNGGDNYVQHGQDSSSLIQAVIGLEQFKKVPGRILRMREMWERYNKGLDGIPGVTMRDGPKVIGSDGGVMADPGWIPWCIDAYIDAGAERRAELMQFLKIHRIGTRAMYPVLTLQPVFEAHPDRHKDFPVSRLAASTGLFLPSSAQYSNATIDLVCDLIRVFFAGTTAIDAEVGLSGM